MLLLVPASAQVTNQKNDLEIKFQAFETATSLGCLYHLEMLPSSYYGGGGGAGSVGSTTGAVVSVGTTSIMRPFAISCSSSGGASNTASTHSLCIVGDGLSAFDALRIPPSAPATEHTVSCRGSVPGRTALELVGEDACFILS